MEPSRIYYSKELGMSIQKLGRWWILCNHEGFTTLIAERKLEDALKILFGNKIKRHYFDRDGWLHVIVEEAIEDVGGYLIDYTEKEYVFMKYK